MPANPTSRVVQVSFANVIAVFSSPSEQIRELTNVLGTLTGNAADLGVARGVSQDVIARLLASLAERGGLPVETLFPLLPAAMALEERVYSRISPATGATPAARAGAAASRPAAPASADADRAASNATATSSTARTTSSTSSTGTTTARGMSTSADVRVRNGASMHSSASEPDSVPAAAPDGAGTVKVIRNGKSDGDTIKVRRPIEESPPNLFGKPTKTPGDIRMVELPLEGSRVNKP